MLVYYSCYFKHFYFFPSEFVTICILSGIIFSWDIIRCSEGGFILALPIMFVSALATFIGNSVVVKNGPANTTIVSSSAVYPVWLALLRFSMLCWPAHFIDFFGISYADGFFANMLLFFIQNKYSLQLIIVSHSCVFTTGSFFFRGFEWYEREASDMLGCFYTHSTDRRVLLMPYCSTQHPLQKTQRFINTSRIRGSVFLSFLTWCNI